MQNAPKPGQPYIQWEVERGTVIEIYKITIQMFN